jgi:hypothetical protein
MTSTPPELTTVLATSVYDGCSQIARMGSVFSRRAQCFSSLAITASSPSTRSAWYWRSKKYIASANVEEPPCITKLDSIVGSIAPRCAPRSLKKDGSRTIATTSRSAVKRGYCDARASCARYFPAVAVKTDSSASRTCSTETADNQVDVQCVAAACTSARNVPRVRLTSARNRQPQRRRRVEEVDLLLRLGDDGRAPGRSQIVATQQREDVSKAGDKDNAGMSQRGDRSSADVCPRGIRHKGRWGPRE